MQPPLYHIELLTDVFADACLRDESGRLLFLSCYSRDTSMQQMFAAFSLPPSQGGMTSLALKDADRRRHQVEVGDADRLGKLTGRLPKDNLFGNLVHTWLFDKSLLEPDFANRQVWLMDRREALSGAMLVERIWAQYRQLSPVPLLEHWRDPLLAFTREEFVTALDDCPFPPLGDITAFRIRLGDAFLETVSTLVKKGILALELTEASDEALAA